jgi:SNF2 family DNA or RNA helicase
MDLLPFLKAPWNHQREGVKRALDSRDFAFFFEQGTGKSKTTIDTLRNLYAINKRPLRTLILCPVVVCENWRREFYMQSKIGHLLYVLKGKQTERIQSFKQKIQTIPPHIFVTNYEALQMGELLQEILAWQPEVLVCDESQRLKSHDSKRAKMAAIVGAVTKHNFILSGTPILNTPMDIFQQYKIMDRGATFGKNFYEFRATYFIDRNIRMPSQRHFPDWQIIPEREAELTAKIYSKAMRVLKSECLDLPDLVRVEVPVEMAREQKRLYEEMKHDFVTFLNDEACTAQLAIVKALRLQQIVSGYIKTDLGEEVTLKENPRLDALEGLLEDIPETEKVIIWANFKENYRQITGVLERMKIGYVELHGGVAGKDRQKNIDAFQTNPSIRAIVANQGAGGVGVNLTAASYAIFYSRNFSLEADLQAEARNHRGGSEIHQKITRYDIVCPGSIDEIVANALKEKQNLAEKILELRNKL